MTSTKALTHAESVRRLIREFGADINVRIQPISSDKSSIHDRRKINASLISKFKDRDVTPYEWASDKAQLTVVWDYVQPETNPSRVRLTRLLAECRLSSPHVAHLWCVPEALGKPPLAQELAMYREWLIKGLYASGSKYVLLVGARPMWVWRPELRMTEVHGRFYIWKQAFVIMPISNPLSVLANRFEYIKWVENVRQFVAAILTDTDTEHLSSVCIKCDKTVYWYDGDGVPWCREHFEKADKDQSKGVRKWQEQTLEATNMEMFP